MIALAALVLVQQPVLEHRVHRGEAMGSSLEIQVLGPDPAALDRALEAAVAEIARLERLMTDWKDEGPLMEVNRRAGLGSAEVPEELFFILERSVRISELTDGAFDITFAAAGRLWRWWEPDPPIPTADEVRAAVENVGWRHLVLDAGRRTAYLDRRGARIGLGAVGPGYAGDRAMRKIRDLGVRDAVVNLSGDVLASGTFRGRPWDVSVRHPRRPGEAFAVLPVSNLAVSTSGDYERGFVKNGKRYGHIIDPRTGYPAEGCQSVTVTAPTLAFADALATAIFVLGPENGRALAERVEGVEALIVAADGTVTATSGLHRRSP